MLNIDLGCNRKQEVKCLLFVFMPAGHADMFLCAYSFVICTIILILMLVWCLHYDGSISTIVY